MKAEMGIMPPHPDPLPYGEREAEAQPKRVRGHKMKPQPVTLDRAKNLRKNLTDVERKLWYLLKNRSLVGHKFRRQHPVGPYIVDFVCLNRKLIIELDGSQHNEQLAYDAKRAAYLKNNGFRLLRFWNNQVLENMDGVLTVILNTLTLSLTGEELIAVTA